MHIVRQALRLEHEQNDLTAESEILRSSFANSPFLLRSSFVLPSFFLRSSFAYCPLIVHRLSIGCPSVVHRFDGETMEKQCRKNGLKLK